MKGYKGFDKDFKCNGFQYEVGKEYIIDGDIKLCSKGFHFCKSPLNVWAYYPQVKGSRYAIIEAEDVLRDKDGDTKRVCKKIKIVKELTALELIEEQIKYAKDKKSNTGDSSSVSNTGYSSSASNTGYSSSASNTGSYSSASNTGDHSSASNTGYSSSVSNTGSYSSASNTGDSSSVSNTGYSSSASNTGYSSSVSNTGSYSSASNTGSYSSASNTGNYSSASNTGNYGIAVAWGKESKAKGKKGNYIVISEWSFQDGERILICAKMVKVDGKKIKEDVYYTLKGGKVVEVK